MSPKNSVEWHWEWEVQNGRVTKNRMRKWVGGVEEEKPEFSSSTSAELKSRDHNQKVADEEGEIDFITMKRKVQPRGKGPAVMVDERGFEKMAPKVGSQLGDPFEMRSPQPPQPPKKGSEVDDKVAFQMPPRSEERADTTANTAIEMPPPKLATMANNTAAFQMPPPPKPPATTHNATTEMPPPQPPKMVAMADNTAAFQMPPPPKPAATTPNATIEMHPLQPPKIARMADNTANFEMPPPPKPAATTPNATTQMPPPQSPTMMTMADNTAAFQMPPPPKPAATTTNGTIEMPPPGKGPTAIEKTAQTPPADPDVTAVPEPTPEPKDMNASRLDDVFQMPPPSPEPMQPINHRKPLNPDIGIPQPRATKTSVFVPPPNVAATDAAAWNWEPFNDPTGTKTVDEAWRSTDSVTASTSPTPSTRTPTLHSTPPAEDVDLESLLPHHIRASMSRHTPSTYPPASSAETNTWTETFGTPSEPTSYTTLTLEPLAFTASTHVPLTLLRTHTSSFLSRAAPPAHKKRYSPTPEAETEAEWLGFDPTPATTAESVFVFLLFPSSSTPSFALTTLPASIPAPTQELRPTKALDLLQPSGMFLPYLRAAREAGGRLVHASPNGVTWNVADQEMGWGVVNKLEAVGRLGMKTVPVGEEEIVAKPVVSSECVEETSESGRVKEKERPKEWGLVRRMFWAGVWVGGLTGLMGVFGQA